MPRGRQKKEKIAQNRSKDFFLNLKPNAGFCEGGKRQCPDAKNPIKTDGRKARKRKKENVRGTTFSKTD